VPAPRPRRPLTRATLIARIARLEKKLAQKEAQTGDPDRVIRQQLGLARSDTEKASTDAQRREVWRALDSIGRELR
jgi:hypothetical protein